MTVPTMSAVSATTSETAVHMISTGLFNFKTLQFTGKDYATWQSRFIKSFVAHNKKIHALEAQRKTNWKEEDT
jgi:hypothetical protein